MSIGVNLKKIRESKNLTISELSLRSKVGKSTISEIESGKAKKPQSDTISKLAEALDVSIDCLFGKNEKISNTDKKRSPEVETIAAHLDEKAEHITPEKMKEIKRYIDFVFSEFEN